VNYGRKRFFAQGVETVSSRNDEVHAIFNTLLRSFTLPSPAQSPSLSRNYAEEGQAERMRG
jgi:hypothetical protein